MAERPKRSDAAPEGSKTAEDTPADTPDVDGVVSGYAALVRAGDDTAVISLLRDPAYALAENDYARILDRFPHHGAVHAALIDRDRLPPAVAGRLLRLVEDAALRERLLTRHDLSSGTEPASIKASRHRPAWWASHIRANFR